MSDQLAISTSKLTKKFGDFISVNDVTFEVKRGEIFGFLGSNGAGKTTTIRMLCGILPPTSGDGVVAGYNILTQPEKIKENIGYMSQKFSLYAELTVEENIDFFSGAYKLNNNLRVDAKQRALEISRLMAKKNIQARNLATGWRQRLALACALLHNPKIVFLDEPTAGVDPISRRDFWDLIYELASDGVTIFVTTHFLDEAEHCTSIGLIHEGKIVAQGSPQFLKNQYQKELYRIDTDNPIELMEELQKEDSVHDVTLFGSSIHASFQIGIEPKSLIKETASRTKSEIRSFEKITPSLEDVFISIIEKKSSMRI
jgi:ABC-2 type transport system ATP-binding protein